MMTFTIKEKIVSCALGLLMSGCTSFAYYQPEAQQGIETFGSACTDPSIIYSKNLSESVILHLSAKPVQASTSIHIRLGIAEGATAQLVSSEVAVETAGGATIKGEIVRFTSGIPGYGIERKAYEATAVLKGQGRYSHLQKPYGPEDAYYAELNLDIPVVDAFALFLPTIKVNGNRVSVDPVQFSYKKSTRMQCLQ